MTGADAAVVTRARALAADVLRDDSSAYEHASRTARLAASLGQRAATARAHEVTAAAWLHDIGYAPRLRRTGFHPLDGALFLMNDGWPERIVRLVAHHSLAVLEAPFYGVGHHFGVIEPVTGVDADILTTADLLGGAGDTPPSLVQRLDAMRSADEAADLVPPDVRKERYAGLLAAHARVSTLL